MNISSILNSTRPISLYDNKKDKDNKGFADVLEAYSAEKEVSDQVIEYTASAEDVQAIEEAMGQKISSEPRYSVTDEEAEYFREKYGEEYDEDTVADLFYELADEGIISDFDASSATCCKWGCMIQIYGAPPGANPTKWAACPLGEDIREWRIKNNIRFELGKRVYSNSRDVFPEEYKEFKRDYDKDIITWEDYIQSQRDFYEYMRNRDTIYDAEGNQRPNNPAGSYDRKLERLERAADIIKQIFG